MKLDVDYGARGFRARIDNKPLTWRRFWAVSRDWRTVPYVLFGVVGGAIIAYGLVGVLTGIGIVLMPVLVSMILTEVRHLRSR